jgi:16S rRNA (cytosine967-C5)-methyltransferase
MFKKTAQSSSSNPLSAFFAEFCETQNHLDSLLSQVEPTQKSKVARKMGIFLRRPWTVAQHFGIQLAPSRELFWQQSFIELKKSTAIHDVLQRLWKSDAAIPANGAVEDFPESFTHSWESDWGGPTATQMARLLSQDPSTVLRLTRLANESDLKDLEKVALDAELKAPRAGFYSPWALRFHAYAGVMKLPGYEQGHFEIQDEGSQVMSAFALADALVAPALQPDPAVKRVPFEAKHLKERLNLNSALSVVDACAGSGGKTLAMADLMQGKGRLFAYDIFPRKIAALKKRAERAQERNIQAVVLADHDDSVGAFEGKADRVLIDAPCSGWGVLRRNPDIKWPRRPRAKSDHEFIPIEELQRRVFRRYVRLLKPGGVLTYGVCTFQKAETLDQVSWILAQFPELSLQHSGFIGPHECDGFYMASFKLDLQR